MTPLDHVLARLGSFKKSGNGHTARCPAHTDQQASLSIGTGTDGRVLLCCHAGCTVEQIVAALGLSLEDLFPRIGGRERTITATYPYRDEHGTLLYEVVRFDPKDFRQRRPDGNGGWLWNLNGARRVLYLLPEILDKPTVFICEGEKDCARLWPLGIPATTCPGGAGKWHAAYSQTLAGKRVVILPDNDEPGENHALAVARSLLPVAAAVKIVRLPGLPAKGDVSDWLDQGHTREELAAIVQAAPILRAEDCSEEQERTSNRLTLTKLCDLLSEPEERVAWLIDKILPAGGFSLLVAKPKAGKSTLARNLALAVAQGQNFFNRATQQGAVIYLALEEKRSEVKKHFQDMGATGEEDIYIHAATAPADALKQIRTVAEEKKPVLIIIDPLFRLTRVKDGNDYAQVTAALEPLLVLARETGAHVLAVHHAGKSDCEGGDAILGSTAIFAAVDTALFMKRSERYRTVSSQQRYGEDLPETVLRFDPTSRTVTLGESKEQEEEKRVAETITDFLKSKEEPVTEVEIDAEVEGRTTRKRKALRELVTVGAVERTGKGGKKDPFRYTLTDSCSLFPQDIKEHGNKNQKTDLSPQETATYSCSQGGDENGSCSQPSEWEEIA